MKEELGNYRLDLTDKKDWKPENMPLIAAQFNCQLTPAFEEVFLKFLEKLPTVTVTELLGPVFHNRLTNSGVERVPTVHRKKESK